MELWARQGDGRGPCMERKGVLLGKVHLVGQELRKEGLGNEEG